jgi:hypothetical protein
VVSHIGQQLVADIELTALRDDAAPVQVRLASADVYRGAGIAMPPVLSGLNLSVVRRGGRQFLSVTSLGPVQSDYLHLYLELAEGNERAVRLATLWLTPDPNPAPQPEPKPAPAIVPSPAGSVPQPALQPAVSAPAAHAAVVPASRPKAAVSLAPAPAVKAAPPAATAPLPLAAARPASCPRPDPALLKTCVALDYKNAQLNAHLGQLEDKVKVLQRAMGAAPHPAKVAARVVPPAAKPKKAAQPAVPAFPWLWLALGGVVLLAGVGGAVFVVRRKAAREREAKARKAAAPPIMPGVKNRLMPEKSAPDEVAAPAGRAQE